MAALWRVAACDLRGRRLQTALFFLVVAVAASGITAGLAQQRSAAERWDDAFRRANGAHVALYGGASALRRVEADPQVVQAAGPSPVTFATLVRGHERIDDVEVRAAGARRQAVGTPLLFGGRWLSGRDPGEVVVERSFALAEGIAPGDRIRLRGAAGAPVLDVVGVALNLVDCFYPECESQTAWTSGAAVDRLAARRDQESLLLARIAHPDAVGAFTARAERIAGTGIRDVEDWKGTRGDALRLNQFFGAFLASFGVFLLVAAGLVILSAVSARVLARYREMGILKAVGFTPRSLAVLVLGENLAIAALGAVAGMVAGALLAPTLQLRFSAVLEHGSATFPAAVLAGAVVIVLVIVVAATLLPAARAGRVPASQAIARGAAPVSTRPSRAAALGVRLRLGAPAVAGIKDAGARPLRAWLTVGALVVTVMAFVAALAMDRSFGLIADDPALAGTPQGITIDPGRVAPARIAADLSGRAGVQTWFTATERQAAVGSDTFQLRALGGDLAGTGYVAREGRMIAGPGEAVVGYGLERRLGVHIGDRLPLRINGRRLSLRVVGRYAEGEDTGERAMITLTDLRRVEPGADPGAFLVRVAPRADRRTLARAIGAAAPAADVSVEEVDLGVFDAFRAAFYAIGVLVLLVGLVNLVGSTLLGIRERTRDLAILKTLGFTPGQVALSVAVSTGALALAAVAIGVPAGLLAADLMLATVGRGAGVGPEFGAAPSVPAVALVALGIIVLATGVGALVAQRAARAPVAEVLRAE